jgi:WD40 repeat protein
MTLNQPASAGRSPDCRDPADEISLRESQELLHQELAALPEHLRLPLVLCYLQGRTRDEAARRLGWSLATLIRRLEQGRKLLHARLSRRGLTLPAVLSAMLLAAAEVPASLAASTLGLATSSLAGSASLPASVAALLAKASWSGKLKAIWGLVLVLGACAGAGAWAHRGQNDEPAAPPAAHPESNPPDAVKCETPSDPAHDGFGDPLPSRALVRLGTVRRRHAHPISGIAFSRDGKSIYASDFHSGVHVWDVAEGKEVRRLLADVNHCEHLALSSNGRTLAVALRNRVRLCDPISGRELASLPNEDFNAYGNIAFSRDGSLLATVLVYKKSVRIWDVASRRLVREVTFPKYAQYIGKVAFSSDGKLLVCDVGSIVCLWDLAQGKEVRQLRSNADGKATLTAIVAPKGSPLAVWGYEDRSVRLFDANGVKEIRRFQGQGGEKVKPSSPYGWAHDIHARFSPNGKNLAIFRDVGRIELWDVASGKKLHTLTCDRSHTPSFLAFSPDGTKLASAGGDLWRGDHTIRLWDVTQGKEIRPFVGHGSPISSVALSPDGITVATADADGIVHLWERSSGKHLHRLEGDPGRRRRVIFSSDRQHVISWGDYGREPSRIWDTTTGQAVSGLELHKLPGSYPYWTAVSENGKTALSVDQAQKGYAVRFHDLATGAVTREVASAAYYPLALSSAGDKMVCSDGILRNAADGKEIVSVGRIGRGNPGIRFSADGRRLVAAVVAQLPGDFDIRSDPPADEIAVIDPIEGKELRRLRKKVGSEWYTIEAVTLSRDGKMVVASVQEGSKWDGQTLVILWETATGRERGHFHLGRRGQTSGVAISADGRFIVSGGSDTSALVWDATRPQTQKSFLCQCAVSATIDFADPFKDLAGEDAERAYASMWALRSAPKKAVSFLGHQSSLFERTDVRAIQRWVRDLDSDTFAERERASQALDLVLDEAESHLKKALQGKPSLELRRRIEALLEERSIGPTRKELQRLRVIEVLEHIVADGTGATRVAAVAVLKKLAVGAPAWTALEAKAALERLERRADEKN